MTLRDKPKPYATIDMVQCPICEAWSVKGICCEAPVIPVARHVTNPPYNGTPHAH